MRSHSGFMTSHFVQGSAYIMSKSIVATHFENITHLEKKIKSAL